MGEQLWEACSGGNVQEVITLLRSSQINTNWQDSELSRTPFYRACGYSGNAEIVKLLLNDKRVDINKAQSQGVTPFYIACQEGHNEIVKLLLDDHRVDINKTMDMGATPFFIACGSGCIEIVKLLLNDKRVDINQADRIDETPFYIACQNGHIEIVKLLLNDNKLDIKKANSDGVKYILASRRGIDINQRENGKTKVVELIESFLNHPNETRTKLRIELGFAGNFTFFFFKTKKNFFFHFLFIII